MRIPMPKPSSVEFDGEYAHIEPLDLRHASQLYAASTSVNSSDRFQYLSENAPNNVDEMAQWISKASGSVDKHFYAVVDKRTMRAEGRFALMRIDQTNGVLEIGSIYWGPAIARTRVATEALALAMRYAFEELGARRLEWKCNTENVASQRAALRLGFVREGVFRQHMIVKGRNRDTAWFSMLDSEWPARSAPIFEWLDQSNFGPDGSQLLSLEEVYLRTQRSL